MRHILRDGIKHVMEVRKGPRRGTWIVFGVEPSLLNAWMRSMTEFVRTLALEDFQAHTFPPRITPEALAYRFSSLALDVDPSMVQPCADPRAPTDMSVLRFEVNAEAPSATDKSANELFVTAKHLRWVPTSERQAAWFASQCGDGYVPSFLIADMPIASLRPGERIHCTVQARVGMGLLHAKYWPLCGQPSFRPLLHMTPRAGAFQSLQDVEDVVAACPMRVFGVGSADGAVDGVALDVLAPQRCNFCTRCHDRVEIAMVENAHLMELEAKREESEARVAADALRALLNQLEMVRLAFGVSL